jgi:glycosyltransferase involved in cell wall biosynthesis
MLISVITVCFNSEKTIRSTLDAMLVQTFQNFEYIIVDGGSTDATLEILNEYKPKFNGKLFVKSEKDNGIYDAMNKGISRCHGELIGIVNSDDWYEPDTLEKVKNAYTGSLYEVIYGMQRVYQKNKVRSILFYHHDFLKSQMITHPTCFVTRKTYEAFGVFDAENYRSSADYELMLRYYLSGKVLFTPVYSILSNFMLGGISSSHISTIETAKLKRKLKLISYKKYLITVFKAIGSELIGNNWR